MLRELGERRIDYSTLVAEYSARWDADFQRFTLPQPIRTRLADEAISSLRKQREIEAADTLAFEDFLIEFYAQYVR
jgi:glutamate--cysteine ligase